MYFPPAGWHTLHHGLKIAFHNYKPIYMETQPLKLHAPWEEVKEQLKETNIHLTDEDLAYQPGKEEDLLDRLQEKMNKSKEDIRCLIESISANKGIAG